MTSPMPRVLILTAGSEVVSLALAEAAWGSGTEYAVAALCPKSVLVGAPGCAAFFDLSHLVPELDALRDGLLNVLRKISEGAGQRVAIFPTEDGGLRLLNECCDEVIKVGEFSRARKLRMGGTDKAELFDLANKLGIEDGLSPALILDDPGDAVEAIDRFGMDAVFKPALKPLGMDLSSMGGGGAKLVTRIRADESVGELLERLGKAWPLSRRWVAQPRLSTGPGVERSVCAVRGRSFRACQVVERAKFPKMGGTAFWVAIDQRLDLVPSAARLMDAADIVGVCELSYLPDQRGHAKLIELNPRPWLQVGLLERAGFPVLDSTICALGGMCDDTPMAAVEDLQWFQPERALAALVTGQLSWRTLRDVVASRGRRYVWSSYSSKLPKAKLKIFGSAFRRLVASRP